MIPREVCDFDSFGSPPREIPNGWTEVVLSGDPEFSQHTDTFYGPPSLMVRSIGGTFKVAIYTQVNVTPGAATGQALAGAHPMLRTPSDANWASIPPGAPTPTRPRWSGDPCIGDRPASSTTRRPTSTST
ncbi:MAG: hypothetical protein R2854_12530 [Caldilineaceae bacterium]